MSTLESGSVLPHLITLNLSKNAIEKLPPALAQRKYLQSLDVSGNRLSQAEFTGTSPLLAWLSLASKPGRRLSE